MERISIFNYEAFYLDFLEGNLNEEDTAMLMEFLKKHPELVVDMDELPSLEIEEITAPFELGNQLKQVDVDNDTITLQNAESFVIALIEEQLSAEKSQELIKLSEKEPKIAQLMKSYQAVKLTPDYSIVFGNTAVLKQSRRLVLWPYVAAAASVLAFVFMYQFGTQETTSQLLANSRNSIPERVVKTIKHEPTNSSGLNATFAHMQSSSVNESTNSKVLANSSTNAIAVTEISKKDIHLDDQLTRDEIKIVQHAVRPVNTLPKESTQQSTLAMNELKNPIQPITNRLSDFTKTDIDLRTAKADADKKGGFYLKIGNLEIERPSRR